MAGTKFTGPILNRDRTDRSDTDTRKFFSNLPMGQEPDYCVYMNDFLVEQDYAAADWTITTTEAGSGSATEALAADEPCGALLITNDDADNDSNELQLTQENWRLTSGKKLWMEMRLKVNDATQSDLFVGLAITDTTIIDGTTDSVGFRKDDGDVNIDVVSEKDSTEELTDSGKDLADDTYVKLGFFYNGAGSIRFFVDRNQVAEHTTTIPDDENLCVTLALQNGAAAAKTMTVDYIYVAQER